MLGFATFPPASDGMARYVPQHVIKDSEAWTIFDAFLTEPGYIQRRGGLVEVGSSTANSEFIGVVSTTDPNGTPGVIRLTRNTSPAGELSTGDGTLLDTWPYAPAGSNPQELFDAKDALHGGAFIGTAPEYSDPDMMGLALWRGALLNPVAGVTLHASVAIGDTTFTVDDNRDEVTPGHFVFDSNGYLVGVVKTIDSSTGVIVLEHPALVAASSTVDFETVRGMSPRVSAGRITTAESSTTVNGGDTKFSAQGLGTGTWDLYTPDFTYIGTVSSVVADSQLELGANATVSLLNSDYLAIRRDGDYDIDSGVAGWLNASFAGHQFFAKGHRLYFSDLTDPEALDLTENGNSVEFSSDPIRALIPTETALVVLTEREAFALNGAVGTTPDRWRGDRINDDGTFCGMGAVKYKGGMIYAGKRNIWFWDGADPVNISANLAEAYRDFIDGANRAWGMIANDHYFVHILIGSAGPFQKIRSDGTVDFTRLTFVCNLRSGLWTLLTNVGIRGATALPADVGYSSDVVFGITSDSFDAALISADDLFQQFGSADAYTCLGDIAGPDLYVETKLYDFGDSEQRKWVKALLLHYLSADGALSVDAVSGLEETTTATAGFVASSTFTNARVNMGELSQVVGFRIYQTDSSPTEIILGHWAVGYRPQRPGRA